MTNPSNPVTVPATPAPALTTVKSSTTVTYAAVGDVIDYTITVTNTGNVTLTDVDVTDPNADPGSIVCVPATPLTLAPGASTTCDATHTVTQADLDAGSVVNIATSAGQPPTPPGGPTPPVVTNPSNPVTVPATPAPALTTVKSSTTVTYAAVGDVIDYTITVTNTGNVTLTDVDVTDPLADPGSIVCVPAAPLTLAPGASTTCDATHTVTQADLDAGSVVNIATSTGQPPTPPGGPTPPVVTNPSNPVTVPATPAPALTTVKSSTTVTYATVGDVIDYTITVTNTGNVTLTDVDVTDPLADPGSIVCVPATPLTLAPGASTTCDATHTVTQADLDAGSVVNIATSTGQPPTPPGGPTPPVVTNPSNPVTVPATPAPALTTVKSSTTVTYATVGDVIDYTITVTNTGNVTLTDVDVTDPLADPGSIVCVPATPLTLAPGASTTCDATHTVTQADLDAGSVVNIATSTGQPPTPPGGPTPPVVTNPSNPVTVPATPAPALTTVKSSTTVTYATVGDVIDYTITVTNTGNVTLTDVDVTDPLADPGSIICVPATPLTLAPGASTTCDATHTVTQADLDAGSVVNIATSTGQPPTPPGGPTPPVVTNPSNPVTVPATPAPALTTVKSSTTVTYATVGDVIDYTITVTNTGNVTLTDVDVTDPLADPGSIVCVPATPLTLAPGASTTCDATHTVTQADLDAGSVVNIATSTGQPPTPPGGPTPPVVTNPSNPVTVPATPAPALTTVKSSTTVTYATVGDVIDYTITVTNTGNVTLTDVDVTDPLADPGSHRLCSGDAVDVGAGCLDDL